MAKFPTRLKEDSKPRVLLAKDRNFKEFIAKAPVVTATGDVSLKAYCVTMDQLSVDACAGNATAESEEILSNIAGYKPTPVSRLFIYNLARNEYGDLAYDNGTYIRNCFDVLSRYGVCDEYLFPYDVTKITSLPPLQAMRQALGHKITAFYRITDTVNPQDRIDACVAALRANHPIVFGTQVSSDFQNLGPNAGPQKPPTIFAGGHALVIVGWVDGNFLVKNSWGTSWGDGGFCTLDPSYITWNLTNDLWVPTLAMNW